MRYTGRDAMESQGIRDVDRWKDKIEVRLDNRQVAFLFFGSALVACMLFILGVVVGKRLESRGRAMTPEIEDPLALLDRVAASTGSEPAPRATAEEPPVPVPASAPVPDTTKAPPREGDYDEGSDPKPAALVPRPAATAPNTPTTVDVVRSAAPAVEGEKARFVLQIGAFADRAEAEAFAATFAEESPTVVSAEIPGRGIWYRVRFGSYSAFKDAVAAKMAFEKRHNKIALVVGPL